MENNGFYIFLVFSLLEDVPENRKSTFFDGGPSPQGWGKAGEKTRPGRAHRMGRDATPHSSTQHSDRGKEGPQHENPTGLRLKRFAINR